MSFKAFISHEGFIRFEEYHSIDYARLHRKLGPDVSAKLQYLLQSKIPILHPNLLRRCKNAKKYHVSNRAQAVARGIAFGLASGLTYGLTDVAFAKSFPRFKEKHLPAVKEVLLAEVVKCGFDPNTIVVVNQLDGENDLDGIPDLVPDYQFWILYIRHEFPHVDFPNFQKLEDVRHNLKLERIRAEKARLDATGNSGAVGLYKTIQANKRAKLHTANADALVHQWVELQEELAAAGKLPRDYQDDPTVIDSIGNSQIDLGYQAPGEHGEAMPSIEEQEIEAGLVDQEGQNYQHYAPEQQYNQYAPEEQYNQYETEQQYDETPQFHQEEVYLRDSLELYEVPPPSGNVVTTTYHEAPPQDDPQPGNLVTTTYHVPASDGNTHYTGSTGVVTTTTTYNEPPPSGHPATTTSYHVTNGGGQGGAGPALSPIHERRARKENLVNFNAKAKDFLQKLKQLIKALETDYLITLQQRLARHEVSREFYFWLNDSPLKQFADGPEGFSNAYAQIESQGVAYENDCKEIIQQAEALYELVAEEASVVGKKGREMTNTLDHYESKVESLRAQYTRVVSTRGREGAYTINDRLHRNEDKLSQSQAKYAEFEIELIRCDELLDHSWIVLCPLIAKSFRLDSQDAVKRGEIKQQLQQNMDSVQRFVQTPEVSIEVFTPQSIWTYMREQGPKPLVESMQGDSGQVHDGVNPGITVVTEQEFVHEDEESVRQEEDYYQCAQFSLIEVPPEEYTDDNTLQESGSNSSPVYSPGQDTHIDYIRNQRDPSEIARPHPVSSSGATSVVSGGSGEEPPMSASHSSDAQEESEIAVRSVTSYNIQPSSAPEMAIARPQDTMPVAQHLIDDDADSEPDMVIGRFEQANRVSGRDEGLFVTEPGNETRSRDPTLISEGVPSRHRPSTPTRSRATVSGPTRRRGIDP